VSTNPDIRLRPLPMIGLMRRSNCVPAAMLHATSRGAFFVCVLLLGACAPVRVRQTPQMLAALNAREAALRPVQRWRLQAHIAVSNGRDGGSGQLEWRQNGQSYRFVVRAPVTGRTWKLSGDAGHAVLEGVDPQPDRGPDASRLLRERLGWNVPIDELGAWIRGLRAPGSPAQVLFNKQTLPAVIHQGGWTVEYRDWYDDREPPLPRKVFASKGNARVRVVVEDWSLHE